MANSTANRIANYAGLNPAIYMQSVIVNEARRKATIALTEATEVEENAMYAYNATSSWDDVALATTRIAYRNARDMRSVAVTNKILVDSWIAEVA